MGGPEDLALPKRGMNKPLSLQSNPGAGCRQYEKKKCALTKQRTKQGRCPGNLAGPKIDGKRCGSGAFRKEQTLKKT